MWRFIQLYKSAIQNEDEFQTIKSNLEINLDPLSIDNTFVFLESNNWYLNDINNFKSSQMGFLASHWSK